MANIITTITKENQLFFKTEEIYNAIMKFFEQWEGGEQTDLEFPVIQQYFNQLKGNLKKLGNTSYFSDARVLRWMEDFYAIEDQVNRIQYEEHLRTAIPWIVRTYNVTNGVKGVEKRITVDDAKKFINILVRGENVREQKNKIKALMHRTMSDQALVRLVNAFLYNSNSSPLESAYIDETKPSLNEDFYNPYDDEDDNEDLNNRKQIVIQPTENNKFIKGIKLWNNNRKDKIVFFHNRIIATSIFVPDDIIEEAPVYLLDTRDLYAPRIREIAFEIDPEHRLYGIPMGLADYYRNSSETGTKGNADYTYDPKEGIIRIYALEKIRKGEEIVLRDNSPEYENQVKPNQFKY